MRYVINPRLLFTNKFIIKKKIIFQPWIKQFICVRKQPLVRLSNYQPTLTQTYLTLNYLSNLKHYSSCKAFTLAMSVCFSPFWIQPILGWLVRVILPLLYFRVSRQLIQFLWSVTRISAWSTHSIRRFKNPATLTSPINLFTSNKLLLF